MTKIKSLLSLLVLAVMATFLFTKITSSTEAVAYDYEERERFVETVEFDDYGNDKYENKEECKEYRRYDDYRCDSDRYRCTRCKSESGWGDGYEYDVYKIERRRPEPEPEPEPVEFWVNVSNVQGTAHWKPDLGGAWPVCARQAPLEALCKAAGYNRYVGYQSGSTSGPCASKNTSSDSGWRRWSQAEHASMVKCAY